MIKRLIIGHFQQVNQRPIKCRAGIHKSTRMVGRATYTSRQPIADTDYLRQKECLFTEPLNPEHKPYITAKNWSKMTKPQN